MRLREGIDITRSVITKLNEIPESAFLEEVEIIGWMYQFYISAKKHIAKPHKWVKPVNTCNCICKWLQEIILSCNMRPLMT